MLFPMHPTPAEFMARVRRLEARALPKDGDQAGRVQVEAWLATAKAEGMSWVEALEYVIRAKHGGAH